MRIWHVIDTLEIGGAEVMVATLCRLQQAVGFRPEVHCLARGGPIADELRAGGVPVHVHSGLPLAAIGRKMFSLMRPAPPDVVHCHNETPTTVAAPAARIARVRRVLTTYHGMVYPKSALRLKFWLATRFCDRVVAVSRTTQTNLEASPLSCPRKISLIYNSAAPARGSSPPDGDIADGFRILHIARHVEAKDQDTLLRAFAIAHGRAPELRLALAGSGPLTDALRRTAAQLRIEGGVTFLGERADVGALLTTAKLFALSSIHEGLPISLLEAMAAGVPQIVTDVGGMPEILALSQAGVVVPPRDPAAMAEAMLRFHAAEPWRKQCAAKALECYQRHFTPERMAQDYLAIYRN